jgi:hypothetical protein
MSRPICPLLCGTLGVFCLAVVAIVLFLRESSAFVPNESPATSDSIPAPVPMRDRQDFVATALVPLKPKPEGRPGELPRPRSEDEAALSAHLLASSREVDLGSAGKDVLGLWKSNHIPALIARMEKYLAERHDLKGLPLQPEDACQTNKWDAKFLGRISRDVREIQGRREWANLRGPASEHLEDYLNERVRGTIEPELYVRIFEQMYQEESEKTRLHLVTAFGLLDHPSAKQALARRAVFDPSPWVRQTAVEWIRWDDRESAREVFVAALRYPWSPAANHAALALVALKDADAVPQLRELLDEPDPSAPYQDKEGKWVKKELVRLNHLRNCLLCHPTMTDASGPLWGVVPTPGEPLPRDFEGYYKSLRRQNLVELLRDSTTKFVMVRADVVYFRQDFSVMHWVKEPDKWPEVQRFDYLVQTRELSVEEAESGLKKTRDATTFPQREAIRWALAKLAGEGPRK